MPPADPVQPPRLYSYVVRYDAGFAPNPFYGYCTVATCKPDIRRNARVGDWIIGTGSAAASRRGNLVYAMRVAETLTYDQYWEDMRFRHKRPNLRGSLKQRYGDNIYHHGADGSWVQEDGRHSMADGSPNGQHLTRDTRGRSVLISTDFVYFGREAPTMPARFTTGDGSVLAARGHKVNFSADVRAALIDWLTSDVPRGIRGEPYEWRLPHR